MTGQQLTDGGKVECGLLPSFIHLVEKFVIWINFSTFGHISWLITAPEFLDSSPSPGFVCIVYHSHRQHETTPKWLDHNKTWLAPQSTASLGVPPPTRGYASLHTYPRLHGGRTTRGHSHPHRKGDGQTAHCARSGPRRGWTASGHPGERIVLLCSAKAPLGNKLGPGWCLRPQHGV